MKKVFLVTAAIAGTFLMGACQPEISFVYDETVEQEEQQEEQQAEQTDPGEQADIAADTGEPAADEPGFQFSMIRINTSIYEHGDSRAEYLVVTGLDDPEAEQILNEELHMFATWGLGAYALDPDALLDGATITSTTDGSVVGGFFSVRQWVTEYTEGAAYPATRLETSIFDLSSGMNMGRDIQDFVQVNDEWRELIAAGVFEQVHPEPVEGGTERLLAEFGEVGNYERRFYLTEYTLGLYFETLHAEGGYWAFEAEYEAISSILNPGFAEGVIW